MYVICIARHQYLSEHICSIFGGPGVETAPAVGFNDGLEMASSRAPDVVIFDYDLLALAPLERWEREDALTRTPVLAVSMSRRPEEVQLLDINSIAGFLYLPTLSSATAATMLQAAVADRIRPPLGVLRWSSLAEERRTEQR